MTQKHFPKIYLDNNASTALDPVIISFMTDLLPTLIGNPSSIHSAGQKAKGVISLARAQISSYLKVKPQELIFTSGGSEGVNMAIAGLVSHVKNGHIITSLAEHACVLGTVKHLETQGFTVTYLEPGLQGAPSLKAVLEAIKPNTCLIALMAVNNETGVKTDIASIAKIAEEKKIAFFVDGVSLLGKEPFTIDKGISAMAFSGHKLHAPQGVGVCFIRSGLKFSPLILGGEQENGRRAGTENVLGIAAFGKAVELLNTHLPEASKKMDHLKSYFEEYLKANLKNVEVNGSGERTVNVSNLSFGGIDGEGLLIALDTAGIAASHVSACSSGALEPSRVLLSMGLPLERVNSSIRFSLSRFTTEDEIKKACDVIVKLVHRQV